MTAAPEPTVPAPEPTGPGPGLAAVRAARTETQAKIIAVATELFAEQGYHATGVAELGRAVGLGAGALYHHIGSKEELLLTIVRAHLEDVLAFGTLLLAAEGTAVAKLHELAREHMRLVAHRRTELLVMLRELDSLTGQRRADMLALRDAVEDVWNQVVRRGVEAGELTDLDPMFVKVVLGAMNYSLFWFQPDGSETPEQMADRILNMLLKTP
ncbi:TetR/AcrR family transcriptional regulator [Pseudonocardia sp. Cha107L01]|uniref:TetR/AcrR family transcriptional regulator n=1 Tax=Pseudonocardia sp. Cha107L01 TaxID=3457576 RepID=UPI00403E37F2